jgi:hypothetical protein
MLIRGIYYDGWNPSKVPVKMDREAFLAGYARSSPTPSRAAYNGWSTLCCRPWARTSPRASGAT